MKTRTAVLLCLLIAIAVGIYTALVYPSMPARIPTHWGVSGTVDGWGSKSTLLIWPALPLASILLLFLLPWLSPKNFKIDSFRRTFNYIMVIVSLMFGYMAFVIIYGTRTPGWDLSRFLISGIMLFIGLLGNLMGKVQRNFYVGIRTPWTLASDKVWVATHRLGARLMTAAGVVGAILVWLGVPYWFVFWAFMATAMYPVLYSLLLYKRLERAQAL